MGRGGGVGGMGEVEDGGGCILYKRVGDIWGLAGVYEYMDGYCIVSGERLHSEIPSCYLWNF